MSLTIEPATSARELRRFIDVPWKLYDLRRDPVWVPPLRLLVREALDDRRNRFYRRAERALWIARRDGRTVGRIAAIANHAHNEFHHDRVGFFGFFECEPKGDTAAALLSTAESWLRARGFDRMRGPMSPSTNHECGLLVDGFEHHPMFMTTWNAPYYAELLTGAGMTGVKDLLGYRIPVDDPNYRPPARLAEHAARARARQRVVFRDLDLRRWDQEVALCWEVYNDAWEPNWGFVPMDREEFVQMAEGLKFLIWPRFAFAAEVDGEPAGFCLLLPDYARTMRRIGNGRLLPTGFLRLLHDKRTLRSARVFALGVRKRFRSTGIFALFMHELFERGRERGITEGEASWVLEDNEQMKRPLVAVGAQPYRRWRIYERPIA